MSVATWWLYPIAAGLFPVIADEVHVLYSLLREPPGPVNALPLLIFVIVAEELVWRGLAVDPLTKRVGSGWAVALASALYVIPQIAMRSPLSRPSAAIAARQRATRWLTSRQLVSRQSRSRLLKSR